MDEYESTEITYTKTMLVDYLLMEFWWREAEGRLTQKNDDAQLVAFFLMSQHAAHHLTPALC